VLVAVEGETVDHEGVAEEIEVLTGMAAAVGASDPEGVDEVAVDRFGVVPARVETGEVGVRGGMGRTFSGRLRRRARSASVPWMRTVMVWAPRWSGSR
jgi:hypothetical protein